MTRPLLAVSGLKMAGVQTVHARVFLRYGHHNIHHGDQMILSALSNSPYGTTVGVFQEDMGPNDQQYLKCIGILDHRDSERINHIARPQLGGAFRPRGGPRVHSRFMPDIASAEVSNFSPQYNNTYPANYGLLPGGPGVGNRKPYIMLNVVCRT